MKNKLLFLLLLLLPFSSRAQTVLAQETFDTNGEGTRYTSNTSAIPNSSAVVSDLEYQFFERAAAYPYSGFEGVLNNRQGTGF